MPLFGDFLASASEHIDAAVCYYGDLPGGAAREVIGELERLIAAMARYVGAFTPVPADRAQAHLDVRARVEADAGQALREAAASLRADAKRLGGTSGDPIFPAARHLAAAADALTAGHDLLQTHFTPARDGSRTGRSRWAPVITSEPVTAALLSELAGQARQLAPWAARLPLPGAAGAGLPGSAPPAVSAACRWLQVADTAARRDGTGCPPAVTGLKLLHAIPANTAPARRQRRGGEPVAALCTGTMTTAERLRYLAAAHASRTHPAAAPTAAGWQRTAHGAAITGHNCELVLRLLADRASSLGINPAIPAALRHAADATSAGWAAWRAGARAFDTITTGKDAALTRVAAEIGDLAIWAGRLAHTDPAWAPVRGAGPGLRDPADLAFAPADIPTVLAAVHHTSDALAAVATADRETIRDAAATGRLFIPTRLLPAGDDIPYPYAPAPGQHIDTLLATYDNVITSTASAARILDDLANAIDAPSSLLTAIRAANRQPAPHLAHRDRSTAPPPSIHSRPGQVERALRTLRITEPGMLARAAIIDDAAADLIAEGHAKTQRRGAADPGRRRANRDGPELRHPASLAVKDSPHRPMAAIPGAIPEGNTPRPESPTTRPAFTPSRRW